MTYAHEPYPTQDDDDPLPTHGPYPRLRTTVEREIRDTTTRCRLIKTTWTHHQRQVDACRTQLKLAAEALALLTAELKELPE